MSSAGPATFSKTLGGARDTLLEKSSLLDNERLKSPLPDDDETVSHAEITHVFKNFLHRFGYVNTTANILDKMSVLTEACMDAAVSRGYIVAEDDPVCKAIPVGAELAYIGYAHRSDEEVKLFITLYTAFLVHVDDMFEHELDAWMEFCGRLIKGQPQRHRTLEHTASLIADAPVNTVASNVFLTSTLNFIIAPSLDHELKGVTLPASASRYPEWSRVYSGAAEAFSLLIFSRDIPLNVYLPAMPDLAFFLNYVNDLFSFYKETLQGDIANYVFSLARSRAIRPTAVLQELADDLLAARRRILDILRPHKQAYDMFSEFSNNYVGFHLVSKRYKLEDLGMVAFIMQEM